MLRIQLRTGIIIGETIAIVVLAGFFGWYYYHVQNSLQYVGDPRYDPNGYQTQWVVGTATNNVTGTVQRSTNGSPTANITAPFSVEARQMNSYMSILFAPCVLWSFQNVSGSGPPPTCSKPASMEMYVINSGVCLSPLAKDPIRYSYDLQSHRASNILYESGNITHAVVTTARFPVPAGDNCIIIIDSGQTDLSVIMNAKIEFTSV